MYSQRQRSQSIKTHMGAALVVDKNLHFINVLFIGFQQKPCQNEVLNKICDFGDEPDRRLFLERLFGFLEERNAPITAVPTISKTQIDLYRLYFLVKERSGMVEVCFLTASGCELIIFASHEWL